MTARSKSSDEPAGKVPARRKPKPTLIESLSEADLLSLRLDEAGTEQFRQLRAQMDVSRKQLREFEAEDTAGMDDARYDLLSDAQKTMTRDATAMVHFLAPRVMKLREGEAKRKWRSFVTKLQKDNSLV